MKKRKKRAITLIEIMIVILLIGLIGGALAYNMTGSLDEGKAFKTRQNMERIHDIVMMQYAQESEEDLAKFAVDWKQIVLGSPLVRGKANEIIVDGWKKPFKVDVVEDDVKVTSEALKEFENKKKAPRAAPKPS